MRTIDTAVGPPGGAEAVWAQLPAELAQIFEPHVAGMTRCIIADIRRVVPEYSQAEGLIEARTVDAVSRTIFRCLAEVAPNLAGDESAETWAEVFRDLGRCEFLVGRDIDTLQMAYHVGGRAAWRYFSRFARDAGLSADLLCLSAEAIFATVNDISSISVAGYAEAKVRSAGATERQRARLLAMLLTDPPASAAAVAALAAEAGWTVPDRAVAVAITPGPDGEDRGLVLDDEVLRDLCGPQPCLVSADPHRSLARLGARLPGRTVAIGPPVGIHELAGSLAMARAALRLVERGILPSAPVIDCCDHLVTMWLAGDEFLADRIAEQALAPFAGLAHRQRDRLASTLLAWLQCHGNVVDAAQRLGVHPQTVRYRMNQITELLGERLRDPDTRFAMEIALRAGVIGDGV